MLIPMRNKSSSEEWDFYWVDVGYMKELFDQGYFEEHMRINHFRNHYEVNAKRFIHKFESIKSIKCKMIIAF